MSSSRAAPSSMEYSVCTWRWTNESADDPEDMCEPSPNKLEGLTDHWHRSLARPALWRASRPPFLGEERQPTRPDQPILTRHTDNPGTAPTAAPTPCLDGLTVARAGVLLFAYGAAYPDLEEPTCPARLSTSRFPRRRRTRRRVLQGSVRLDDHADARHGLHHRYHRPQRPGDRPDRAWVHQRRHVPAR